MVAIRTVEMVEEAARTQQVSKLQRHNASRLRSNALMLMTVR
jgi:hypothetical protein